MASTDGGTIRHALAIGVAVLAFAACSSSDDADGDDAQASGTEPSASVDGSPATDVSGSDAEASGGGDGGTFCDQVRALDETPSTDNDLSAAAEEFERLIDVAPDEVRDDLEIVSDAFSEVAGLDQDDPESFTVIFEIFGRPEVVAAAENLERYGVEECGLEPSGDAGDPGESVDTAPVETGGEDSVG